MQVILDVPTRWNSTLDMLVRLVELKDLIQKALFQLQDMSLIKLWPEDHDWKSISELIEILSPLKKFTLTVSGSGKNYIGITRAMVSYHEILKHLRVHLSKYRRSEDIYVGISCAISKITHYYDQLSPIVGIAVLLNPNMKKEHLVDFLEWKEEWVEIAMKHFYQSYQFYAENIKPHLVENSPKRQRLNADSDDDVQCLIFKQIKQTPVKEECKSYLQEDIVAVSDVLGFWKDRARRYPILSAMAKDYLTVQASSVPSERAFSSAGNLVTSKRGRLKGETIRMVEFLKAHIPVPPNKYD